VVSRILCRMCVCKLAPVLVQVRGQAGRALTAVAASLGPPGAVRPQDTQRLLRAAGTLVTDNTPDARNSARELISIVQVMH
jgi:hypothetical protein